MYAERLMVETDRAGKLKNMPKLRPNRRMEAIFIECVPVTDRPNSPRRRPHPDVAGKVKITGNIMDNAPTTAWDLPA